jgi:hypothetical protein
MQYADVVVGLTVPQVVDMEEFVGLQRQEWSLKWTFYWGISIDNSTVRFKGRNRIYYNYIKIRLVDDFEDSRLYCSVLNPAYEESASRMYQQSKPAFTTAVPVFGGKEVIRWKDATGCSKLRFE